MLINKKIDKKKITIVWKTKSQRMEDKKSKNFHEHKFKNAIN